MPAAIYLRPPQFAERADTDEIVDVINLTYCAFSGPGQRGYMRAVLKARARLCAGGITSAGRFRRLDARNFAIKYRIVRNMPRSVTKPTNDLRIVGALWLEVPCTDPNRRSVNRRCRSGLS